MEIVTSICGIVSVLLGGGLLSVALVKEKVREARIDNDRKIIEMYSDIAKRYEDLACFRQSCADRIKSNVKHHIDEKA